jgi:hypothetical protein
MATYIYLPIPTQEMKDFASKLNLGGEYTLNNCFLSGNGKAIARFFGGCLGSLKAWDELLVICHGAGGGSRFTGAQREGQLKKYDPQALVRAMEKEGLTKSFINLKLLICGSGEATNAGVTNPFAERVCAEMKQLGYSNIRVTGYLGEVSTDGGKITVLRNGEQGGKYYDGDIPGSYKVYR